MGIEQNEQDHSQQNDHQNAQDDQYDGDCFFKKGRVLFFMHRLCFCGMYYKVYAIVKLESKGIINSV